MNADQIETIVGKLLSLKQNGKTDEELNSMEEFNDFKQKNRMFYETIILGQMDHTIFKRMMKYKREIEAGGDSYGADVKFGKYMAEKYVDPVVNKIPPK